MPRPSLLLAFLLLGPAHAARPAAPKLRTMETATGPAGTVIRLGGEGLETTREVVFAVGSTVTRARFRVVSGEALDVVAPEYYRQGAAATVAVFARDGVTVAMPPAGRVVERAERGGGATEPGLSFDHVLKGGAVRELSSPGVIERGGKVDRAANIGMVFVKAGGTLHRFDEHAGVIFHERGAIFGDEIARRHPMSAMGPLIPVGPVSVSPGVGPFVYLAPERPRLDGAPRRPPLVESIAPGVAIMGEVVALRGRGLARTTDVFLHDRLMGLRPISFRVVSDVELRAQMPDQMTSLWAQFVIVLTTEGATVTLARDDLVRGDGEVALVGGLKLVDYPARWVGPGEAAVERTLALVYVDRGGSLSENGGDQVVLVKAGGKFVGLTGRPRLVLHEPGADVPAFLLETEHVDCRRVAAIEPSFLDASFRLDYGQLLTHDRPAALSIQPAPGP